MMGSMLLKYLSGEALIVGPSSQMRILLLSEVRASRITRSHEEISLRSVIEMRLLRELGPVLL